MPEIYRDKKETISKYDGEKDFVTPEFKNTYTAEGTAVLAAMKANSGHLDDRTFTFRLEGKNVEQGYEDSEPVTMGETYTFTTISYTLSDLEGEKS